MLGDGATLAMAAALAEVDEPLTELEEACDAGLLDASECSPAGSLAFAHPLVRAAVYGQLTPARRLRLHHEAALLVGDERAALHHRAEATQPPDDGLAAELQCFSDRVKAGGEWREAAWALLESGRLSGAGRSANGGCCGRSAFWATPVRSPTGRSGSSGRWRRTARCATSPSDMSRSCRAGPPRRTASCTQHGQTVTTPDRRWPR